MTISQRHKEEMIAIRLGWKKHTNIRSRSSETWESPFGTYQDSPPPYTRCLNTIHKAWRTLTPSERTAYEDYLYQEIIGDAEYNRNDDAHHITNATASQRAEAFGRLLGLW